MTNTNAEFHHYAVFSCLLLLPLSSVQISPTASYSQMTSSSFPLIIRQTNFTLTDSTGKWVFFYTSIIVFTFSGGGGERRYELNSNKHPPNFMCSWLFMNVIMIMMMVFWVMAPYSLVDGYRPFGGTCLPEKGGTRFLRNVSDHLLYYTRHNTEHHNSICPRCWNLRCHVIFISICFPL